MSTENKTTAAANVDPTDLIVQKARRYQLGTDGYKLDLKRALELNIEAAELGNPIGMFNVGWFNDYKIGMNAPDLDKAFSWYMKSANVGYAPAMIKLGDFFLEGKAPQTAYTCGGDSDSLALKWYIKAARKKTSRWSTSNSKMLSIWNWSPYKYSQGNRMVQGRN